MAKRRFPQRKNLNKTNIQNAPNNKPAVYKITDKKGKNIYTGVAQRGRVQDRLAEHMRGGTDSIPGASAFAIKQKGSINSAKVEEKQIIKSQQPKINKQNK